jgi:hydrogenase nickel incorporation protein HypA/HybF
MHELAIAEQLVDHALDAAEEAGADRVDGLTVELGAATHLAVDQLRFCVDAIVADTPAADATVEFERVPARGECVCGWAGELDTLDQAVGTAPARRCPDCGRAVSLTAGDECRLATIDVPEPTP